MAEPNTPELRLLHEGENLVQSELDLCRKCSTESLRQSLLPGQPGALKVRPEGTSLDGNHRIKVLIERGVNISILPRETNSRYTDGGLQL